MHSRTLFLCLLLLPCTALSQQRASERQAVDVTVYNQNLALIREERTLEVAAGINRIVVPDIPATIDGTSLHFVSLTAPEELRVLEQNYQYDLIHQAKLLEKYVGKEIEFVRVDPATQKEYTVRGRLLATGWQPHGFSYSAMGSLIAEINGKIEVAPAGRIVLPALPEGLIVTPQLEWKVQAAKSGKHRVELSYLAGQLSWECTYVALVSDDDSHLDLTGWVTLTNNSGSRFTNAGLKLVAGDVNLVGEGERGRFIVKAQMSMEQDAGFEQKEFFEYKLYTLQRKTDINDRETKQIELVSAKNVTATKMFVYDGAGSEWRVWSRNYSYREQASFGQQSNPKVGVYITFKNSERDGLGMPLPKGKVRLYKRDTDNKEQFIGEDRIDHTPKDEEIRLYTGNAFDLVGKRVQKDFRVIVPGHVVEETFEITIKNHKNLPVVVAVYEHPWRWQEWKIVRSSQKWEKVDQSTIRFYLQVPSDAEEAVLYTVRYSW